MGFHYEDIFPIIGDLGPFQAFILFVVHLPLISVGIDTYAPLFTLYAPRHRCRLPETVYQNDSFTPADINHSRLINKWISKSRDGSLQECCLKNSSSPYGKPQLCQDFVYDKSVMTSSAAADWNFVCGSRSMVTTSECVMWTGVMAGAVLFGSFSDKFGRANAVNLAVCVNIIGGILVSISPYSPVFLITLFCQGSTLSGLLMSSFVLAVEHIGPSKRHLVSVINHVYVAVGCMVLALMTEYIKDWRILHLSAAATALPCLLFFNRNVIPESPRWLFAKHRMEELYAILERAARINKIKGGRISNLEGMNDASISIVQAQPATGRVSDVFNLRRPNFLGKTLIIFLNWFVISVLYYGLTMQAGKISSSIQMNLVISGSVELAAFFVCALLMSRIGRRQLLVFSHFLSAFALLGTLAAEPRAEDGVSVNPVVMALLMMGKFGSSISFTVICIYSCEIFPTVVRSLGVGFASCFGRFGGVMAPLIASVDQQVSVNADPCEDKGYTADAKWSFVITGSLALLTGVCTLMLPETFNEPLPETCDDAEEKGLLPCFRVNRSRKTPSRRRDGVKDTERSALLPSPPLGAGRIQSPSLSSYAYSPAIVPPNIMVRPRGPLDGPVNAVKNHYVRLAPSSTGCFSASSSDLECTRTTTTTQGKPAIV